MPEEPLVYIIILHWIHLTDTIECLESIAGINYKNFKVVLINNDIDNPHRLIKTDDLQIKKNDFSWEKSSRQTINIYAQL